MNFFSISSFLQPFPCTFVSFTWHFLFSSPFSRVVLFPRPCSLHTTVPPAPRLSSPPIDEMTNDDAQKYILLIVMKRRMFILNCELRTPDVLFSSLDINLTSPPLLSFLRHTSPLAPTTPKIHQNKKEYIT